MKRHKQKLYAVDLFCGAGGLTYGLKKAGFKVVAGIDIEKDFAKTYKANHPDSNVIVKDIRNVNGKYIKKITGVNHVALLAGCPPCQGFSQLIKKINRPDPRNSLPFEMVRLVEELEPDMVMMENVPGITKKGMPILNKFIKRLEKIHYQVTYGVLQLADFGVPQVRRRFVLLAGKGFEINLPKPTHSRKGGYGLKPWRTMRNALRHIRKPPVTMSEASEAGGPKIFNWHVVRDPSPITLARLRATKEGANRYVLPNDLRPKCHRNSDLGFCNVYGRLSWDQTPGTMTSGCTTLSMGRFGHPTEDRTISIREAASIQTFPVTYRFATDYMAKAAMMVGNALPPLFASIISQHCADGLLNNAQHHL